MADDSPVLEPIDVGQVPPVVPEAVTRTAAGNKSPYEVNGRSYRVMASEAGYVDVGNASWYGRKFHGHLTSNGEIYDMFKLSAAHRSLPLPSFLRVTNLDNGKSVVVRVNDRGPFHDDRIVDLSYAAAVVLGYAEQGTAQVRIEAVLPETTVSPARPSPVLLSEVSIDEVISERQRIDQDTGSDYLQVGAFANLESARRLLARLNEMTSLPGMIYSDGEQSTGNVLHKVRLGPVNETIDLQGLIEAISSAGLGRPFRVRQ